MRISHPLCMGCTKKRARFLMNRYGERILMYCSVRCAAEDAMNLNALKRWCNEHQEWYHADHGCDECADEYRREHR
jgi:hypothetical protein